MNKTEEEKKWKAECDARTLMEAEAIRDDRNRASAAMKEVRGIMSKAEDTLKTAKKVKGEKSKPSGGNKKGNKKNKGSKKK